MGHIHWLIQGISSPPGKHDAIEQWCSILYLPYYYLLVEKIYTYSTSESILFSRTRTITGTGTVTGTVTGACMRRETGTTITFSRWIQLCSSFKKSIPSLCLCRSFCRVLEPFSSYEMAKFYPCAWSILPPFLRGGYVKNVFEIFHCAHVKLRRNTYVWRPMLMSQCYLLATAENIFVISDQNQI